MKNGRHLFLAACVLVACGDDDSTVVGIDGSVRDANVDGNVDAPMDAPVDGDVDAPVDATVDAPVDAAPDADVLRMVDIRVGNMTVSSGPYDFCFQDTPGGPFRGPILADLGLDPLAPGDMEPHRPLAVAPGSMIRWVEGNDCAMVAPGTLELPLGIVGTNRHTMVYYGPPDALTLDIYESDVVGTVEPTRFYTRFFHAGVDAGVLNVGQVNCNVPFSAFENVDYAMLGNSPNNMATFFSAAVTAGQTSFSTTIVLCDGTNEVLSFPYTFPGGEVISFFLHGDGDGSPYRVTDCSDGASVSDRCIPLSPM